MNDVTDTLKELGFVEITNIELLINTPYHYELIEYYDTIEKRWRNFLRK